MAGSPEGSVSGSPDASALGSLAAALVLAYGWQARHGPALADEFIYLAGAKHFARSLSLDARFYDAEAILRIGHPHQDVHSPGYVILLGGLMAAVRGGYWTAVALNVAAYLASAFLVRGLAAALGRSPSAAWAAGALYLVLPAFLPYVFWAMAEVVLGALFLAALWVAAVGGQSRRGVVLAGLLFGLAFLVRESALFGLPPLIALLLGRGRVKVFLATVLAVLVLVYAPLSRQRAPGGANFWAPTSGKVFGFETVQAARGGRLGAAAGLVAERASRNLAELVSPAHLDPLREVAGLRDFLGRLREALDG